MAALRLIWILALSLSLAGCLPHSSVSLAIRSENVQADTERAADVLKALGYSIASVTDFAPKGAIGFRAYQGQFTVVAPDQEKSRVVISFSEVSSEFSPKAKSTYYAMLSALREQFGSDRVDGAVQISATVGSNPAPNSDLSRQAAPVRLALR